MRCWRVSWSLAQTDDDERRSHNAPHEHAEAWIEQAGCPARRGTEMFYGLATVVEEFFVPALNIWCVNHSIHRNFYAPLLCLTDERMSTFVLTSAWSWVFPTTCGRDLHGGGRVVTELFASIMSLFITHRRSAGHDHRQRNIQP